MNFNNYTTKSQETIQHAQQLAQRYTHNQIENEHIFKALTKIDENVLPFLLKKLNINISIINQILDKQLENFPKVSGAELMISREASKSLNEAAIIAKNMKDDYVSIEHLILAIFKSKSNIAQVLKDQGVTEKHLKAAIEELRKGERVTSQNQEETYNSLNKYAKYVVTFKTAILDVALTPSSLPKEATTLRYKLLSVSTGKPIFCASTFN